MKAGLLYAASDWPVVTAAAADIGTRVLRAIAQARFVEERREIEARDQARLAHVEERDRVRAGDREGGAVAIEGRRDVGNVIAKRRPFRSWTRFSVRVTKP